MTLRFDAVTRRYGDTVALNRVSLEAGPGILALVGPNGAGKSSFMRVATGHVRPTAGRVEAFGQTVWDNPQVMRRVGLVPEQDAFYEWMTGHDFVATLGVLQGLPRPRAEEAAAAELDALGLEEGMDRPIRTYSKGMRQRVKLAQALIHGPDLLLLDEPLLGCDPVARRRIQDRVKALAKEGCTIIVSTHILPEVERLTHDIAVMAAGRLVAHGDAGGIRDALSEVPSRIRLLCGKPRVAAADVSGWDDVVAVRIRDGAVEVETSRMRTFLERLQAGPPSRWALVGHEAVDADLDSVFTYLAEGSA